MRWGVVVGVLLAAGAWAGEPRAPGGLTDEGGMVTAGAPRVGGAGAPSVGDRAPAVATVSDPELGWRYVVPLPEKRSAHAVAAVGGKVYVIGGWDGTTIQNTLYVYDPGTNAWSAATSIPTARDFMRAVVVGPTIYVIGGGTASSTELSTVEAFNTQTNTWTTGLAPMPTARRLFAAAAVGTTIYAVGGASGPSISPSYLSVTEAYDTVGNAWTTRAALPVARAAMSAVAQGGVIYVAGGSPAFGQDTDRVDRYDPVSNAWTPVAGLASARRETELVAIRSFVYGGGGVAVQTAQYFAEWTRYDAGMNQWASRTRMQTARFDHGAAVVNDRLYVVGGHDGSVNLSSVEEGELLAAPEPVGPVGGAAVYTDRPTFAWQFVSPYAGERQGGYEVWVATFALPTPVQYGSTDAAWPPEAHDVGGGVPWSRQSGKVRSGAGSWMMAERFSREGPGPHDISPWRGPLYWRVRAADSRLAWGRNWSDVQALTVRDAQAATVGPNVLRVGGTTTIRYAVDTPQAVTVRVVTANGELVRTLVDEPAAVGANGGELSVAWDGTNEAGNQVASGVYLIGVVGDGWKQVRKLLVIR